MALEFQSASSFGGDSHVHLSIPSSVLKDILKFHLLDLEKETVEALRELQAHLETSA